MQCQIDAEKVNLFQQYGDLVLIIGGSLSAILVCAETLTRLGWLTCICLADILMGVDWME
jgi:hypothetical protein